MANNTPIVIGALSLMAWSCSIERPEAVGSGEPVFKHELVAGENCNSCHEENRPAPFASLAHGGGQDCIVCHVANDHRTGWLPRRFYSHNPKPKSCLDCHVKERPPAPHPERGDCAACHNYPSWK